MAATALPSFTREQVIAYRLAVQGLYREATTVAELGVLDLGVQEAMGHAASVIFAARVVDAEVARDTEIGPGADLALAWTLRGAPHVHRRTDLDWVARALWPMSEADAMMRLNENGRSVERQGMAALDQFTTAVRELRAVVRRPTAKGTASGEVTKRLPPAMRRDCRPCGCAHISDSAMRAAAPAAGLELEPGTSPPVLLRREKATLPKQVDLSALRLLGSAYLTYLGPADSGEVAGYLGARRADIRDAMPGGLTEVEVDGTRGWLPVEQLDALAAARPRPITRLLGAFDPYLQARDRELIVPDKALHKELWPVLGRPGVMLRDGEVVGTWRTKASGSKLAITVETFGPQPNTLWRDVDDEAERIATVRRSSEVRVLHA